MLDGYEPLFIESDFSKILVCLVGQLVYYFCKLAPVLVFSNQTKEFAALTLAMMFSNITGVSIIQGHCCALDTLATQSAGGIGAQRNTAIVYQKSILITSLLTIPVSITWYYSGQILGLFQVPIEILKLSEIFIREYIPVLIPIALTTCTSKWLQAQGRELAVTIVWTIVVPIAFLLQIHEKSNGIIGSAHASICTEIVALFLFLLYSVAEKTRLYWVSWDKECFENWKEFIQLGVSATFMICSEWWFFEIATLMAGSLGVKAVAAQGIIINTLAMVYTVHSGLSIAATNAVGNRIGAERHDLAKKTAFSYISITIIVSLLISAALYALKNVWGTFFTNETQVIKAVSHLMPICALFQLVDGAAAVLGGVLRAYGKPKAGALFNSVSYYVFGIPSSYFLMKIIGHNGILWGLAIGLSCSSLFQFIFLISKVF